LFGVDFLVGFVSPRDALALLARFVWLVFVRFVGFAFRLRLPVVSGCSAADFFKARGLF
jgi:hypothetical protein